MCSSDLMLAHQSDNDIVSKMKMMVPEYVSNNSVFESLDKKVESEAG